MLPRTPPPSTPPLPWAGGWQRPGQSRQEMAVTLWVGRVGRPGQGTPKSSCPGKSPVACGVAVGRCLPTRLPASGRCPRAACVGRNGLGKGGSWRLGGRCWKPPGSPNANIFFCLCETLFNAMIPLVTRSKRWAGVPKRVVLPPFYPLESAYPCPRDCPEQEPPSPVALAAPRGALCSQPVRRRPERWHGCFSPFYFPLKFGSPSL